jgi:hypothetical protein
MRQDEIPELAEKRKMYVVVRGDLRPGLRAAQAAHAVAEACLRMPDIADFWHTDPDGNYLIILEVESERELLDTCLLVKSYGIHLQVFREPDLWNEPTAFAAIPPPQLNHVFAHLPLAYTKRSLFRRMRRKK